MKNKLEYYKEGTILTDGTNLIYLRYLLKPDWTPSNNYGRKRAKYTFCKTYPNDLFINGIKTIDQYGEIDQLWLNDGYHLENFKPIDKGIISKEILKELTI